MKKIIIKFIKVLVQVIYFPVTIWITVQLLLELKRAAKSGKAVITDITQLQDKECSYYNISEYTVCVFPQVTMLLMGIMVVTDRKYIISGCEIADDLLNGNALADAVIGHEQGHINHRDGQSSARIWWNPEDWLVEGSTFTPAEIAADRWALENGVDGKELIKFLRKFIRFKPISILIRIYHIRRYMKNKS